jgi:hypothetical protein
MDGCKSIGIIKNGMIESEKVSEQNKAIQRQQEAYREQAETERRNQNLINVLRGVSGVLSH